MKRRGRKRDRRKFKTAPSVAAKAAGIRAKTAVALKQAAAYLFFKYRFSCHFEVGIQAWGSRRVDIIGNKISGQIVIVEVKSSVADFRNDTKFHEYLPYCDRFYLATTCKVWQKIQDDKALLEKLGKRAGVIVLNDVTGYADIKRPAKSEDVEPETRMSVLARLAWRNGDLSKRTERSRKRVFIEDEA